MEDTKKCPFCAELIKAEAVVCRYCQRDLPLPPPVPSETVPRPAVAVAATAPPEATPAPENVSFKISERGLTVGQALFFFLVVPAIIWWVYNWSQAKENSPASGQSQATVPAVATPVSSRWEPSDDERAFIAALSAITNRLGPAVKLLPELWAEGAAEPEKIRQEKWREDMATALGDLKEAANDLRTIDPVPDSMMAVDVMLRELASELDAASDAYTEGLDKESVVSLNAGSRHVERVAELGHKVAAALSAVKEGRKPVPVNSVLSGKDEVYIREAKLNWIYVATSLRNYVFVSQPSKSDPDDLVEAGKLLSVPAGTKARLVKQERNGAHELRILEGKYAGRSIWANEDQFNTD